MILSTRSLMAALAFFIGTIADVQAQLKPEISGLVRNYNGIRLTDGNDLIVGRNLLRLNLRSDREKSRVYVSGEVLNSYVQRYDSIQVRLREAYADFYFSSSELRIGKQIIARGRANGAIITDFLSPYDLSEFLTQDFTDLRQGALALVYMADIGPHQIDVILNPLPTEGTLPKRGSVWDFQSSPDPRVSVRTLDLDRRYGPTEMQYAAQFRYRPATWINIDFSAHYWEHPLPTFKKRILFEDGRPVVELEETRLRSPIFSLSGDVRLTDGVLAVFEGNYQVRRLFDKNLPDLASLPGGGTGVPLDPALIELLRGQLNDADEYTQIKPFTQFMAGFDYSSGTTYASIQGIVEFIPDYVEVIAQNKLNTSASILLRESWSEDRIRAQMFARVGMVDYDFWLNPKLTWKPLEEAAISLGAQVFGGPKSDDVFNFRLSRYRDNSFLFAKLSWNW